MIAGLQDPFGGLHDSMEILGVSDVVGHWNGYPHMMLAKILAPYKTNRYRPSASIIAGGSWRRSVLERLLSYYPKMEQVYPMLRGTLVHAGLEAFSAPGVEKEVFLHADIPGEDKVLTGKADVYVPRYKRLIDWKTASRIPTHIKPAHLFQLAIYAWLLRWMDHPVEAVAINYVGWKQATYVNISKDGKPACEHPLLRDDAYFIEQLMDGYNILEQGFRNERLPSMSECNIKWCSYCAVKWACDQMPVEGGFIGVNTSMDQHEYTIEYGGNDG